MPQEVEKRKEYVIKVGPKLKAVLEKQRDKIKEALWKEDDGSDYIAGEIIAQKVEDAHII